MTQYSKAIVAAVGAVATWATTYFPTASWVGVVTAIVTALGVFQVQNAPSKKKAAAPAAPVVPPADGGVTFVELLYVCALAAIIVVACVWLAARLG